MGNKVYYDENGTKVIVKKKSGFLGKIVALLLGIIIGVIGGIGGLAFGGYYLVAKVQIKKGVDTINSITGMNFDLSQYLNDDYAEQTILELVGDVYNAAMDIADGKGSLSSLNEISPIVYTIIAGEGETEDGKSTGLVGTLAEYGITVDADKLMTRIIVKPNDVDGNDPDTYLVDYVLDCANNLCVGDLLLNLGYELNPLLKTICYGSNYIENEDGTITPAEGKEALTLGGFLGEDLTSVIDSLTLNDVLGEEKVSENDILKNLGDTPIGELPDEIKTLTIADLVDTEGNKILTALADATLETLPEKIDDLLIEDVVDIGEDDKLLNALKGTKITELSAKIDDLKIEDVVDIGEDDKLLKALEGTKITEIASEINKLQIKEIVDTEGNVILEALQDATLNTLPDAVNALTIDDVFKNDMYETDENDNFLDANGEITTDPNEYVLLPTWSYMLTDKEGTVHHDLTITSDMNVLMDNLTYNLQHETIGNLIDNEIIQFTGTEEEIAEKEAKFKTAYLQVGTEKIVFSNLTIPGILDLLLEMSHTN